MRALITGITGQDGSLLAKSLLEKGYQVFGTYRRLSTPNFWRLQHHGILPKVKLLPADLLDSASLVDAVRVSEPDEIYNLAAQSFVGASFEQPIGAGEITGLGVARMLEAIRQTYPRIRFYQASTSELFGLSGVDGAVLDENTPFQPSSPYAVGKLFAYWTTRVYRESYDIFTANGILFNHETMTEFMPVITKRSGDNSFNIEPLSDALPQIDKNNKQYQGFPVTDLSVWGSDGWTKVKYASAYPHNRVSDNKLPRMVNARCGAYMATGSHIAFMQDGEKATEDIVVGDRFMPILLPIREVGTEYTSLDEAELCGMMVADGSITYGKHDNSVRGKFTKNSPKILSRFERLWTTVTGGDTARDKCPSGFVAGNYTTQLRLRGGNNWLRSVDFYTTGHKKRIPKAILNSGDSAQQAFLKGYNSCDGLKMNLCVYNHKSWKTNSATLAMGLWFLADKVLPDQGKNLTVEYDHRKTLYYSINLLSPYQPKESAVKELSLTGVSQRNISSTTGFSRTFIRKIANGGHQEKSHLLRDPHEVKKIIDIPDYAGWFYDLETDSGEFVSGIGNIHVHNSTVRGLEFVTRKVTNTAAKIKLGLQEKLELGNLNSSRDWGHAAEYVESMQLMLRQNAPGDYVIATGESHSIRELCQVAFDRLGLDWEKYVVSSTKFTRPIDVQCLHGDNSKAKRCLGWEPKMKFKELIEMMVDADLDRWTRWQDGEIFPWDALNYTEEASIISNKQNRGG